MGTVYIIMRDADFLQCLATGDLQRPNREGTEAELCEWISHIIGPGSERAAQRIHANGFTTARAWQAIEHNDLLRAGFTCGDSRALSLAVTNAMMSVNNAERAAIFRGLAEAQHAHDLELDNLTSKCREEQAKLEAMHLASEVKAQAVLKAVSGTLGECQAASTASEAKLCQENSALEHKCQNHVNSLEQTQKDVAARVRRVVLNSGDRYKESAEACKLAMDRIACPQFEAFSEKISQVEARVQSAPVGRGTIN